MNKFYLSFQNRINVSPFIFMSLSLLRIFILVCSNIHIKQCDVEKRMSGGGARGNGEGGGAGAWGLGGRGGGGGLQALHTGQARSMGQDSEKAPSGAAAAMAPAIVIGVVAAAWAWAPSLTASMHLWVPTLTFFMHLATCSPHIHSAFDTLDIGRVEGLVQCSWPADPALELSCSCTRVRFDFPRKPSGSIK